MLFQMLTGVLPFRGDSMAELMFKIAQEEAPDIRIIRRDLPDRLAEVVARSLAKKSEARFQDGDQFAAELREVIALMSGAPQPVAPIVTRAGDTSASPVAASEKTAAFPAMGAAAAAAPAAAERTTIIPAQSAPPPAETPSYDATQKIQAADGAGGLTR
jgi:serine/threonine-protein kinase